ncbi:MAG: DUF5712 family protein [Bacteroidota bacterium]
MNIKIVKAERGSNQGSVGKLVRYLEKENRGKASTERTPFFSHQRDRVSGYEVQRHIDGNVRKLSRKDGKFYLVNISPSQKELQHIGNDPRKLMIYTRQVMQAYAENFGKGLEGKDLVYYAKIEQDRYYHGNDPAVKAGKAKQGEPKPGLQTHIHVIVSRKDQENRLKLSPLSRHRNTQTGPVKGGFDREAFVRAAEQIWDKEMKYERSPEEQFDTRLEQSQLRKRSIMAQAAQRAVVSVPRSGALASGIKKAAGYHQDWDRDLVKRKPKREPERE